MPQSCTPASRHGGTPHPDLAVHEGARGQHGRAALEGQAKQGLHARDLRSAWQPHPPEQRAACWRLHQGGRLTSPAGGAGALACRWHQPAGQLRGAAGGHASSFGPSSTSTAMPSLSARLGVASSTPRMRRAYSSLSVCALRAQTAGPCTPEQHVCGCSAWPAAGGRAAAGEPRGPVWARRQGGTLDMLSTRFWT